MPGEPHTFWDRVVEKAASALASGALQPIETRSVTLVDGGVRFLTRVAANLVRKQVAGKKRGPGFNPFLSPEEDLLIGDISGTHYALLNKFNVIENHVLIVTRAFEEQESLLSQADFEALWISLRAIDGLAFYNAGKESGASQRHKHLQLVRAPLGEGPEHIPMDAAFAREPGALSFRHASCSLRDCVDLALESAAATTRKRTSGCWLTLAAKTIPGPTTSSPPASGWSLSRGPGKRGSPSRSTRSASRVRFSCTTKTSSKRFDVSAR